MNIRFNIEKSQRKALAQKIGELTGSEVKYLGVPSCVYEIGKRQSFRVYPPSA